MYPVRFAPFMRPVLTTLKAVSSASSGAERLDATNLPRAEPGQENLMKHLRNTLLASAVAAALAVPFAAQAESNFTTGNTANITAQARVDFAVTIPKFVFLQVGTGTLLAANGTIDLIDFSVAAASVGNGTPVAGTGGNLTGGSVTVRVIGNNGDMTLGATAPVAGLLSGTDSIAWTQIAVATSGPVHPPINGTAATYSATGKVVNASGNWTYSYLNSVTPPAGSYTGRVTYTATTP
jgi:hypothetical protein